MRGAFLNTTARVRIGQLIGSLLLVGFTLGSNGATAQASAKKRLAVMPLRADGIENGLAASLGRLMVSAIQETGQFEVVAMADIGVLIGFDEERWKVGCNTEECRTHLEKALRGVDELAVGYVRRLHTERLEVSFAILDVRTNLQIGSGSGPVTLPLEEGSMRDEFRRAVQRLVDGATGGQGGLALPPNSLVVLPLADKTKTLADALLVNVASVLASELAQLPRFSIVHQTEIDDILRTTKDPLQVLQRIGARYAVAATFVEIGSGCRLTGQLFERGQATAVITVPIRGQCGEDGLVKMTESLAAELSSRIDPKKTFWPVWVAAGVAAVGAGVGTGFLVASSSDVDKRDTATTAEDFRRYDAAASGERVGGAIGLGVAAVGVITGVVWLAVQLASDDPSQMEVASLVSSPRGLALEF